MTTNNGGGSTRSGTVVRYRECQRNHAAPVMRYAVDGCGEFAVGGEATLLCEACGCHRSFHRREEVAMVRRQATTAALPPLASPEQQSGVGRANGGEIEEEEEEEGSKKKARTKLTQEQKDRMAAAVEKMGWRPQRHDEEEIGQLCLDIGITPRIFKNWINNNRHRMETTGKR